MKKLLYLAALALVTAPVVLLAQNTVSVATGGASKSGDGQTLDGLSQYPSYEDLSLDDLHLQGTSGSLFWDVDAFLRWTGDGRLAAKWEVPASWRLELDVADVVTYAPPGSTNYAPGVPTFFGSSSKYFTLGDALRSWDGYGNLRFDAAIGTTAAFFGSLRYADSGGNARAQRGGSYGSVVDFSVPTLEQPWTQVSQASAGYAYRFGLTTLSVAGTAGQSDGGRTQFVRQFGGFALNRILVDDSAQKVSFASGVIRADFEPGSGQWDASIGVAASNATNRPTSSLSAQNRLFPSTSWTAQGMKAEANRWSIFATAHWRPVESLQVGYAGVLSEETTDGDGYLGIGPFLPTVPMVVQQESWQNQEGVNLWWAPSRQFSLTAGAVFGWRRYDQTTQEGTKRDSQRKYDYRIRMRWRPIHAVDIIAALKDYDRDATGDFGDRTLQMQSASVTAVIRPVRRLTIRAEVEGVSSSADVDFHQPQPSYNRITNNLASLSLAYAFKAGAVIFLRGNVQEVRTYYRGLTQDYNSMYFFGPDYRENRSTVQLGAVLPFSARWQATLFAGQTLLHGTEAYRYPEVAATLDFAWKPSLTLSLRAQYTGFHQYAYSFANGSANLVQALVAWKF